MQRRDWLLLFIGIPLEPGATQRPLDPIRVMKGMFLFSMEAREQLPDSYAFEPYHYGPCSLDIYDDLDGMKTEELITEQPVIGQTWGTYSVTPAGKKRIAEIEREADADLISKLSCIKKQVLSLGFLPLLQKVYKEYPQYATRSIFRF